MSSARLAGFQIPEDFRPLPAEVDFDLHSTLDAVVLLRADVPEQAFTASILGTERTGSGVVIDDNGLVLTIGYLVTEASSVWLTGNNGRVVEGHPLAYDQATGFGLVLPLGRLGVPSLRRGSSRSTAVGDEVIVVAHGGREHALKTTLVARREFAGYWEYLLDEALLTSPPHPRWSGAALVDAEGALIGIGSLFVEEAVGEDEVDGNLFVPVELLEPIFDDLVTQGRSRQAPRPWLGMYVSEAQGQLVVGGLAEGGPAERAGVRLGDLVADVGGEPVSSLADLWREVWRQGEAGVAVPLTLARDGALKRLRVQSADRNDFLAKPRLQ